MKRELLVRSAVIDWIAEELTIIDLEEKKHVLPLDKNIHVEMEGFPVPAMEERDMQARELGAFMSRGYMIKRISFEEEGGEKSIDQADYIQPGDMLDWRGIYNTKPVERIGPVLRIHQDSEGKRTILIASKKARGVEIAVEKHRIIAVYRGGQEVARFSNGEDEKPHAG